MSSLFVPVRAACAGEYVAAEGDTLWDIAVQHGTTVEEIRKANNLDTDFLKIGQLLIIPDGNSYTYQPGRGGYRPAPGEPGRQQYTVAAGDTLWGIAVKCGTTVESIRAANQLESDIIQIGQVLSIPTGENPFPVSRGGSRKVTAKQAGYGELLPWPEADALFPSGSTAILQDFETGRQFQIYRLFGGNHADCEPLTASDTQIMKDLYGGQWSWDRRAALLLINGRAIACSMAGMPHGTSEDINDNNFAGMFDLHFYQSRTHASNMVDPDHQAAVRRAAGL
ncbi:MAG: LysM peptidoglycan-binding domain-containing protein [Firmicutes bacterium]|nr:LysM peptidoglycan-binding domain-containing protein [Bacillota bacterium]